MRVFVTGGTGFVGQHLVRALRAAGHEIMAMSRERPDESAAVPGVTYVAGSVTDARAMTAEKMIGCDAVVHLVGIIQERRGQGQTFEEVHVQGTRNVLAAAVQAGVAGPNIPTAALGARVAGRFVYLSALGSAPDAPARYSQTKAQAEQAVKESGIPYTIFRPSVILGRDGEFVRQMEDLIRKPPLAPFSPPFVPLPGSGKNRFQPVYIEDLTRYIVACLEEPAAVNRTYEIGGGTQVTFDALIEALQRHIGVKKPILHIPMGVMFALASVLEAVMPRPPITTDQLLNLQRDSVCDNGPVRTDFGIEPLPFEQALARIYA